MKLIICRKVTNGLSDSDISTLFGYGLPDRKLFPPCTWQNRLNQRVTYVKKNGFHIESRGREGNIYYAEDGRRCEIYFEISGVDQFDILVYFDSLAEWTLPVKERISVTDKERIRDLLRRFLADNNIRGQI